MSRQYRVRAEPEAVRRKASVPNSVVSLQSFMTFLALHLPNDSANAVIGPSQLAKMLSKDASFSLSVVPATLLVKSADRFSKGLPDGLVI